MSKIVPIHNASPTSVADVFQPTLSPRFLNYVHHYLLDHEIAPEPIFKSCQLPLDEEGDEASPIPIGRICSLFKTIATSLNRPYFGLELSHGYHYESGSMLILAFMAAPNVRAALDTLMRYDKYVDTAIEINIDNAGGLSCFEVNVLAADHDDTEHLSEYLSGFIAAALRKATRVPVPIERVAFTHTTEKDPGQVQAFFDSKVIYGARQNAFHFDAEFLDTPLRSSNPLLFDVLRNALRDYYARSDSHINFMHAVHREVLRQFKNSIPTADSVAQALQISGRSLRRRLAEHGKKFQLVKNEARLQRATFYLHNTSLSLTEIAYELGFSEPSAFSRAFKDWTGDTPQAVRLRAELPGAE